ncbi:MAG TPA: hypothetical protein VMB34_28765 [Acetobacteraceae bacterium]|nr:hypothetical protein [Acetobacteraceae bacterium]
MVVLTVGGGTVFFLSRQHELSTQSEFFIDRTMPGLSAHWSAQDLLERATPRLRAELQPNDLDALSASFAKLGPLSEYLGDQGGIDAASMFRLDGSPSASYVAKASYTNGMVTFQLGLVRRDDRWMIDRFHVDAQWFGPPYVALARP